VARSPPAGLRSGRGMDRLLGLSVGDAAGTGYAVPLGVFLAGPVSSFWEDVPVTPGILTRRLCGTTLLAQAMSVFFGALVAWRLAGTTGDERATFYLWGGLAV